MPSDRYAEVLTNNESLAEFEGAVRRFYQLFVDAMVEGIDFTVKLEVRGNLHELVHAHCNLQDWRRPPGASKRLEERKKQRRSAKKI